MAIHRKSISDVLLGTCCDVSSDCTIVLMLVCITQPTRSLNAPSVMPSKGEHEN